MCFQAFIHYACGHDEIIETACTYAEGIPFFIKHACLDYQSESMFPPNTFCGKGKYYCGKGKYYCGKVGKDGPWLDEWHAKLAQSEADLQAIDAKHALVRDKTIEMKNAAAMSGMSVPVLKMHPMYAKLKAVYVDLRVRRVEVEKMHMEAKAATDEAQQFYCYRRAKGMPLDSVDGALAMVLSTDVAATIPLELQPPFDPLMDLFEPTPFGPRIPDAPPFEYGLQHIHQPDLGMMVTDVDETQTTHVQPSDGTALHPNEGEAPNAPTPQKAMVPTPQKVTGNDDVFLHPSSAVKPRETTRSAQKQMEMPKSRRRRRSPAPEMPPPTPAKDDGQPRRSGRARKQKVSYAEMSGSDYSRDNSPTKSESSVPQSDYVESEDSPPTRPTKPQRRSNPAANRRQNKASKSRPVSRQNEKQRTGQDVSAGQQKLDSRRKKPVPNPNNSLKARPSAHSQIWMQNAAPLGHNLAAAGAGMFGFGNNTTFGPFASNNGIPATLGRPFSDGSVLPAVPGSNLFNSYRQQSLPGLSAYSMGSTSAHPWSGQQGPGHYAPTATYGHHPQPSTTSGRAQPSVNFQRAGSILDTLPNSFRVSQGPQQAQQSTSRDPFTTTTSYNPHVSSQTGLNTYARSYSQPDAQGLQTPSESRADSVTHAANSDNIDVATYFDYPRLSRSYNATPNLSPAKTPDANVTDPLEPKKRALPASSPTPAAKRVRLSLPGDETTSSPAKLSADLGSEGSLAGEERAAGAAGSVLLAPIIAPNAIKFLAVAALEESVRGDELEGIDWGMVNGE